MEQPPGSLDDLQPPDVPAVIDLTKKGEDCVLNSTSLNALRMVKSPGWYPNSGATNPGLALSETGSTDVALQSADQIQPDNAFSRTTVTLSYVSRSHVFSTNDSPSQHSPLYSVPPLSRFSLHPHCDAADRVGETVCLQNQHYPEPVNLTTPPEPLCSLSQAQGGPGKDPLEYNGGFVSSDVKTPLPVEAELSAPVNGECDGCFSPETPQTPTPVVEEEEEEGSEVLFIMSKQQDSVEVPAGVDLCSLTREFRSPLEDPVSPSATSLDDVEDVFVLPQASSSPSAGHSYLETSEELERAPQPSPDISDANKRPASEPSLGLAEDACGSDASENKTNSVVPHMNGNAEMLERKLPMRSGRGMRLEAIVMNINSSRYNVSGCILANKKPSASQSATPKRNDSAPACKRRNKVKTTFSVKTVKRKALKVKKGKRVGVSADICKDSTSDSELINKVKKSRSTAPPKTPRCTRAKREPVQTGTTKSKKRSPSQSSPQFTVQKNSKEDPEPLSQPDPPPTPQSKSPKNKQSRTKRNLSGSKNPPPARTKAARTPKRRRKQHKRCQSSSMFSPKEPEIKLKYVSYKEEKKDSRSDGFSPFVRVQRRQSSPSSCNVINYPEQVKTQHKKRQQQQQVHTRDYMSAAVPSTSCLQLGRLSVHGQHQRALVCCLCGQSANAIDLGDLHGPYYPDGYRPSTKTPTSMSGLKDDEDDYSDSDSSSCSMRGRGRKCAVPPTSWTLRPGAQLKQKGRLESRRWAGDGPGSPAAKRARTDAGSAEAEDWYSPPVLPQEPSEYWLHEDCGIWSAGVFLVKGKVYGLEEAVKVSQETVKLLFKLFTV